MLLVIAHDAGRAQGALAVAREHGFKGLVARRTPIGLALAREYRPDAVLVFAGDGRGERLLGQLKSHPETRHRPVVVAGPAGGRLAALRAGAAAYVDEPTRAARRRPLGRRRSTRSSASARARSSAWPSSQDGDGLDADDDGAARRRRRRRRAGRCSRRGALERLRTDGADCAVLVVAPGAKWRARLLLERSRPRAAARAADRAARARGAGAARSASRSTRLHRALVVCKRGDSPERLIDETALYLHRLEAQLPQPTRKLLAQLRTADQVFHGKRVLIVDDDIRNVFALASALETRGMKVAFAENGREGIERLREHPDTDLVLLDVMMPEMDGYETARAIRAMPRFERAADHPADRQGDEGRPRQVDQRRARRTTSPSRSTSTSCCRSCGSGCTG